MNGISAKDTFFTGGDFAPELVDHIIDFSRNPNFRSATTDELLIDDCFFRRPVRPEDLYLLDFSSPLVREQAMDLGGLIGHRVLLNAFECNIHQPPTSIADEHLQSYQAFYQARTIGLGRKIQPLLQWYLFDMLEAENDTGQQPSTQTITDTVRETWDLFDRQQQLLAGTVAQSPAREQHEAFALIQHTGLLPAKQSAAAQALAGAALLPDWLRHALAEPVEPALAAALYRAARRRNLQPQPHRYWQFYLSTAMGCSNLLYSLCNKAACTVQAWAAILLCRLHTSAFQEAFRDLLFDDTLPPPPAPNIDVICNDMARLLDQAAALFGPGVYQDFISGWQLASQQWALFDHDMSQQLDWLDHIDEHKILAQQVMKNVERNKNDIMLDTFTETLQTCSTTHVHNEHRLVVIESGEMIFWGNIDMRLHLSPGEMILVPRNRLHGSSITTEMCVYHQPIIPANWLDKTNPV